MKYATTLIPMFSLATLLSFPTESHATSPTQKISRPTDVVKNATPEKIEKATPKKVQVGTPEKGDNVSPEKIENAASKKVEVASPEKIDNTTPKKTDRSTPDSTKGAVDPGIQQLIEKGFVIFIPKGTRVPVIFDTNISSDKSRPGDEFSLSIGQEILLEKAVLVPKGSVIKGTVLDGQALIPQPSKLVTLQLRFDSLNLPAYGKLNIAGGKLLVKGDSIAFMRDGKKLFLRSLFVTTPYRPLPPPDSNAFKSDKGKKIEIAAGDKSVFEFSSDVPVSPR